MVDRTNESKPRLGRREFVAGVAAFLPVAKLSGSDICGVPELLFSAVAWEHVRKHFHGTILPCQFLDGNNLDWDKLVGDFQAAKSRKRVGSVESVSSPWPSESRSDYPKDLYDWPDGWQKKELEMIFNEWGWDNGQASA